MSEKVNVPIEAVHAAIDHWYGPGFRENIGCSQAMHSLVTAIAPMLAAQGEDDGSTPPEELASRLIDAWAASHGGQISWNKAIEISAIVTKMPEAERARLLALGEHDLTEVERTAPPRIWLHVSESGHDRHKPFPEMPSNIDWCAESLGLCEVEYLRADLAAQPVAQTGVPEGYALVPIKPTAAMILAGSDAFDRGFVVPVYTAMLAAAPTPSKQSKER